MADKVLNEVDYVSKPTLTERLERERSFIVEGSPNFKEFESLALMSTRNGLEYGIQLNLMKDGDVKTIFNTGQKYRISTPEGYAQSRKVFFHTHPEMPDVRPDRSIVAMTPSYLSDRFDQFSTGDVDNSVWNIGGGKYLNIINSLGVSFMIGRQKHTHTAEITNKMHQKFKVENETSRPILFIKSGKHSGELVDEWTPEDQMSDHLGDNSYLLFTLRVPYEREDYNMLFVTHEKLKELEITPAEICFEDGVDKLTKSLDVEIPHSNNLVNAMHGYKQASSI